MKIKKLVSVITAAALCAAMSAAPVSAGTEEARCIEKVVGLMNNTNLTDIRAYSPEPEAKPVFTRGGDGRFGLEIDGSVIAEPVWDDICFNTENGRLSASLGDENPDSGGRTALQGDYESNPATVSVKKDGKWGAISRETGELIIKPEYNEVCEINGVIRIMDFNGKYGYADKLGNILVEPLYDYVSAFSRSNTADFDSGYICRTTIVGRDYGYTVLDLTSKEELIPLTTDAIHILSNDYFTVTDYDDLISRLYDGNGTLLLELDGTSGIELIRDDRFLISAAVYADDGESVAGECDMLIDSSGKVIIDGGGYYSLIYQNGGGNRPSVFIAGRRGSEGVMTENGEYLSGFDVLDTDGETLFSADAGEMSANNGTIKVFKNGKWGLMSVSGDEILPFEYDDIAFPFVTKDGKTGVIDEDGNFVLEPILNAASAESCGTVELGGKTYYKFTDKYLGGVYLTDSGGSVIAGPYADISADNGKLLLTLPVCGLKVTAEPVNDPSAIEPDPIDEIIRAAGSMYGTADNSKDADEIVSYYFF